jgi:hypothetical protein
MCHLKILLDFSHQSLEVTPVNSNVKGKMMKKPTKPEKAARIISVPVTRERGGTKIVSVPVMNEREVKENRSKFVAVRFGPEDFAALEKYAATDRRPVSTVVWMVTTDFLKAKGFLK